MTDPETMYTMMEKFALAVVTSARKLRPYFQSHPIEVLTNQPLRTILHSQNQSGRLAKWPVKLSEYDIEYKSRVSIKAQVLADFLTEVPVLGHRSNQKIKLGNCMSTDLRQNRGPEWGSNWNHPPRRLFTASNNEAEYEALLSDLGWHKEFELTK